MPTTPPPVIQVSVETPLAPVTPVAVPEVRHVSMSMSTPDASESGPRASNWLGSALALWQRHPRAAEAGSDNPDMNPAIHGH